MVGLWCAVDGAALGAADNGEKVLLLLDKLVDLLKGVVAVPNATDDTWAHAE